MDGMDMSRRISKFLQLCLFIIDVFGKQVYSGDPHEICSSDYGRYLKIFQSSAVNLELEHFSWTLLAQTPLKTPTYLVVGFINYILSDNHYLFKYLSKPQKHKEKYLKVI